MTTTTVGELMEFYRKKHPEGHADDLDLIETMKDWIVSYEQDIEGTLTIYVEKPGE